MSISPDAAPRTNAPNGPAFLNLPVVTNWQELAADAVVFGVPHGRPYDPQAFPDDQSRAPDMLRAASPRILINGESIDTDFSENWRATDARIGDVRVGDIRIVDGGDIPLIEGNVSDHYSAAEAAVRFAIQHEIMPIIIGGNDGITNPVIRGLDGIDDITLIQIDAHMDWADQRYGITDGYSSPMRRASEQTHISAIHQIGIRSFGSAGMPDMEAARDWGSHIHLARDIHRHGLQAVIDTLPGAGKFFIALDVDGLDPSVMPGTVALAPGGLSWWHVIELFEGLAQRGEIVGLSMVEMAPKNDVNQLTMIGAGRLILKAIMLQMLKGNR